jgi:hypothetical protein
MSEMTKFTYRDFYDVPRMIILNHKEQKILLDCKFDDSLDDYPTTYKVYILPQDINEINEISWEDMTARAVRRVGEIPVKQLVFDHTKRAALDVSVIDDLLGVPSSRQ